MLPLGSTHVTSHNKLFILPKSKQWNAVSVMSIFTVRRADYLPIKTKFYILNLRMNLLAKSVSKLEWNFSNWRAIENQRRRSQQTNCNKFKYMRLQSQTIAVSATASLSDSFKLKATSRRKPRLIGYNLSIRSISASRTEKSWREFS